MKIKNNTYEIYNLSEIILFWETQSSIYNLRLIHIFQRIYRAFKTNKYKLWSKACIIYFIIIYTIPLSHIIWGMFGKRNIFWWKMSKIPSQILSCRIFFVCINKIHTKTRTNCVCVCVSTVIDTIYHPSIRLC